MHIRMHTHPLKHTYSTRVACMYICRFTYSYMQAHACMHVYIHMCSYMMQIFIYMYVLHTHTCAQTHTHEHAHTYTYPAHPRHYTAATTKHAIRLHATLSTLFNITTIKKYFEMDCSTHETYSGNKRHAKRSVRGCNAGPSAKQQRAHGA